MVISENAKDRRHRWINEIVTISGEFGSDASRIESELSEEIEQDGVIALLDHLRLCSAIPESYGHDSSEEKLYSKYTDALISASYSYIGLESKVLTERADSADVEAKAEDYSFVADAKVFRLSRTAKNQKDFKVQAMDSWKRNNEFAMIVCPLYQLPSRTSQIYQQAATRNVCIFSYSHLAVLTRLVETEGTDEIVKLLHNIFNKVGAMPRSKSATEYWKAINSTLLKYGNPVEDIWRTERIATLESIKISKEIASKYYAEQKKEIKNLSKKEAIEQLIEMHKITSRIDTINSVSDNRIMGIT